MTDVPDMWRYDAAEVLVFAGLLCLLAVGVLWISNCLRKGRRPYNHTFHLALGLGIGAIITGATVMTLFGPRPMF